MQQCGDESLSPLGLGPNKGPRSTSVSGDLLPMITATMGNRQQHRQSLNKEKGKESNGEKHSDHCPGFTLLQGANGEYSCEISNRASAKPSS